MFLSADEIAEIHETLVDWFAESEDPVSPPGLRDRGLLESAAARPIQSVGGTDPYPTVFDRSAALFHSLINNHPFYNGNKRVALASAQVYLHQGGYWLERCSDDEMYEFTRKAAAHEIAESRGDEIRVISDWLSENSRKTTRGETPMKYSELKEALKRFGFEIDPPDGEFLNIYKNGKLFERIIKQGIKGFRPYHTDYILGLRKRLGLTPDNGVDSTMFYGRKGVSAIASEFIEIRIEVMKRLART